MSDSVLKQVDPLDYNLLPELDCTPEEIRLGRQYADEFEDASLRTVVARKNANYRCRNRQLIQAKAEIANLTLLSDSQLANQERLTEELEKVREELRVTEKLECEIHVALEAAGCPHSEKIGGERHSRWLNSRKRIAWLAAELATERANQERLVGEKWIDCKQELPPDDKHVLVWQNFFAPSVSLARYWGKDLGWHMSAVTGNVNAYVTYWMPMLDPPASLAPKDTPTEPKSAPEEQI